jgi:holo-[acyl-carrier protein] synthase
VPIGVRAGIDLVSVAAVREGLAVHGARYVTRILSPAEMPQGPAPAPDAEELAARIAVKEAVMKLLAPRRDDALPWSSIEVIGATAAPDVRLTGPALALATRAGVGPIAVSVSCAGCYVTAVAIA